MKKTIENIFILGIGGIGNSAIAKYFLNLGKTVAGYDKTSSPITEHLEQLGSSITYEDNFNHIPPIFKQRKNACLVVYTPAIPQELKLFQFFRTNDFDMRKRSEVLGQISKNTTNLSVAGTHGKTTTTAILAHLMMRHQASIIAFVGGITSNYQSNFIQKEGGNENISITEADEFDRSFLQLKPQGAIITSTDADHLDIYKNKQNLEESFQTFVQQVAKGNLIVNSRLKEKFPNAIFYGLKDADYMPIQPQKTKNGWQFDLKTPKGIYQNFCLNYQGKHNLENTIGALSLALHFGLSPEKIKDQLPSFNGIKRRFEIIVDSKNLLFIDDYAHHPKEIEATLNSVRDRYPQKKILGVFQPHLFSRTRDFMADFAEALSKLDKCFLLPIYPAREKPIPGINSSKLAKQMTTSAELVSKKDLPNKILGESFDILLTLGAGDIGLMVNPLKEMLENEK